VKLWLVRHARPLAAEGLCYGATDLEAEGEATRQAARALAAVLPAGLAVRCSPLRRCRQLAEALQALRPDLVHQLDARLREMDFGHWEGQRWDAIGRAQFDAWMGDFARHRCGGGESVADLMERVAPALAEARGGGDDALWVTHAGVGRAVRLLARGIAMPRTAAEWPTEGLAFGAWECLPLGPGKTT
jgi:alpha-ribazole phosphatase